MPKDDAGGGIIRVAHNRENPYTLINRLFTEDSNLSWQAVGVLTYLLCKPDQWRVRVPDLIRRHKGGREAMRTILKELEATGYLVRTKRQDPINGRWIWESTIYENPCPRIPSMDHPSTGEPSPDHPSIKEVPIVPSNETNEYREEAAPTSKVVAPSAFDLNPAYAAQHAERSRRR